MCRGGLWKTGGLWTVVLEALKVAKLLTALDVQTKVVCNSVQTLQIKRHTSMLSRKKVSGDDERRAALYSNIDVSTKKIIF